MPGFADNLMVIQQRLGRRLKPEELRLLQLWDSIVQPDTRDFAGAAEPGPEEELPVEASYEGRFKVARVSGHFEVYFVCSSVLFRGVAIDRKEDVLAFLTQAPISLDEMLVKQAIAGAEAFKPTQIPQTVSVPDPVLRSMGFERN